MDYKAVKKKWDSGIAKNLANFQGNFRKKSFFSPSRRLQWFLFEKIGSIKLKIATHNFTPGAVIFFTNLAYLMHLGKKSASSLTSLNF